MILVILVCAEWHCLVVDTTLGTVVHGVGVPLNMVADPLNRVINFMNHAGSVSVVTIE